MTDQHMPQNRTIPRRSVPGIAQPVSSLGLGFEFFADLAAASVTMDAYYEAGGNLFDTAFVYQNGLTETILGDWHMSRGVARKDIVVIGKGAHSPLCYPDVIGAQLTGSLERLQTDYVDVYLMHRDNSDVPVGEFVDAMNAEVSAGRIRRAIGGSNWTMERLDAAIAHAGRNGKTAPFALSNNFSLAEMVAPIWDGCVASSDAAWKKWLLERQIPNFAWSSQGRGFFTEKAARDRFDDKELVRTWYSEKNFERRDRAIALTEKRVCKPIQIALAYVLAQPFPVLPLIGPRTLGELDDSLSALDLNLTLETVNWLEG